ncbi:MAG: pyridoxamine 5'-phosphate oxidase family protein [Micrococcales bacterium]|nr:pyridoxamine 5'-phosphate oxidase family protein [Micrococcales bacterium]
MMSFEQIRDLVWQSLHEATTRRTPFTLGHLATAGLSGEPRVRAVILREFDADSARLLIVTHAGSHKMVEIGREPRVAMTLYDDTRSVQLRLEGVAETVHDPTERQRVWQSLGDQTHDLYRSPLVPGTPVPEDATQSAGNPEADDETAVLARFAAIWIRVESLDWLDLSVPDHLRWRLVRDGGGWSWLRVVP